MIKKNQKTIEERIEEILRLNFDEVARDYPGWDENCIEKRVKAIKSLLSNIIREIVGKDEESPKEVEKLDMSVMKIIIKERNKVRQEIREKAQKLGLEV